jgi:hypothetical protein
VASRARLAAGGVLAGGLVLLTVGVTVAVVRHNRSVDSETARKEAQRARYDAVLREVASNPPRFEVSFVEFELEDLDAVAAGAGGRPAHRIVPNEVATRLRTGRPPIRPDFGSMPRERDDVFARAVRERRLYERRVAVAALLVTQTTPGRARVRLEVNRLALRAYEEVYDLADLTPSEGALQGVEPDESVLEDDLLGTRSRAVVEWTSNGAGAGALVPVCLLHSFLLFDRPENAAIRESLGGLPGLQVTSNVVLLPRRLFVRRVGGQEVELSIEDAIENPLRLDAGAAR